MKRRFRDVFGVTIILLPRLISAIIVLYLIYYFFAIIGMECFGKLELINCCKNSTVEQFYKNDTGKLILTLHDFILLKTKIGYIKIGEIEYFYTHMENKISEILIFCSSDG